MARVPKCAYTSFEVGVELACLQVGIFVATHHMVGGGKNKARAGWAVGGSLAEVVGHIDGDSGVIPRGFGKGVLGSKVHNSTDFIENGAPALIVPVGEVAGDEVYLGWVGMNFGNGLQLF